MLFRSDSLLLPSALSINIDESPLEWMEPFIILPLALGCDEVELILLVLSRDLLDLELRDDRKLILFGRQILYRSLKASHSPESTACTSLGTMSP